MSLLCSAVELSLQGPLVERGANIWLGCLNHLRGARTRLAGMTRSVGVVSLAKTVLIQQVGLPGCASSRPTGKRRRRGHRVLVGPRGRLLGLHVGPSHGEVPQSTAVNELISKNTIAIAEAGGRTGAIVQPPHCSVVWNAQAAQHSQV